MIEWYFYADHCWASGETRKNKFSREGHVWQAPSGGYVWAVQRPGVWDDKRGTRVFKPTIGWCQSLTGAIQRVEDRLEAAAALEAADMTKGDD